MCNWSERSVGDKIGRLVVRVGSEGFFIVWCESWFSRRRLDEEWLLSVWKWLSDGTGGVSRGLSVAYVRLHGAGDERWRGAATGDSRDMNDN